MTLGRAFDDVRHNGILEKDGKIYRRQAPIQKMLKGKTIDIAFAFNRIVKGFYGIIEAEYLQPSHRSGVQNHLHFIPEAQPRNRSTSQSGRETPQLIARQLRPAEIIEGATAYVGAPVANLRGEIIQGNGRGDVLLIYYSLEPNGETYKNYFTEGCNANFLGFSAKTIKSELAKFKKPVLVRFVDVSDEEAIQLGQFQAKDLEAVSNDATDSKARVNRIAETELAKMVEALLRYDKGDATLSEIIRDSNALSYFVRADVLRKDELEKYTKNGAANAKGIEFVRNFLLQFIFAQAKDTNIGDLFEKMPHHTQKGIEKALLYVLKVHCYANCDKSNHSITHEVANAVGAAQELMASGMTFKDWKRQKAVFNPSPQERFSALELELAKIFAEGKTQKEIADKFKRYAYFATDKPATLVEPAQKALPKKEAISNAFGLNGLGCTPTCGCQKNKVLNGCECDSDVATPTGKEEILTVKLPVSIHTLQTYLWGKEVRNPSYLSKLSESDFVTIWKYTLAANTMLAKSILPKTDKSNKHILHQVGSHELVKLVNEEFTRRGLTQKYTLFTERKEQATQAKEVEKQPYEMTFKQYLYTDESWKKDFDKFIKVDNEVKEELRHKRVSEEEQASVYRARRAFRQSSLNTTTELVKERHKYEVEKALNKGKIVPSEVLKEYPDLVPKSSQSKNTSVEKRLQTLEFTLSLASAEAEKKELQKRIDTLKFTQSLGDLSAINIIDYSDKAFAIVGDTYSIKEQIKAIGGKFNRALNIENKKVAGWIVSKKGNTIHSIQEKLASVHDAPRLVTKKSTVINQNASQREQTAALKNYILANFKDVVKVILRSDASAYSIDYYAPERNPALKKHLDSKLTEFEGMGYDDYAEFTTKEGIVYDGVHIAPKKYLSLNFYQADKPITVQKNTTIQSSAQRQFWSKAFFANAPKPSAYKPMEKNKFIGDYVDYFVKEAKASFKNSFKDAQVTMTWLRAESRKNVDRERSESRQSAEKIWDSYQKEQFEHHAAHRTQVLVNAYQMPLYDFITRYYELIDPSETYDNSADAKRYVEHVKTGSYGDKYPATKNQGGTYQDKTTVRIAHEHQTSVKNALKEGKTVSPEVLKDYPDLVPKSSQPANTSVEKRLQTLEFTLSLASAEAEKKELQKRIDTLKFTQSLEGTSKPYALKKRSQTLQFVANL